jgi:hypothetical protein
MNQALKRVDYRKVAQIVMVYAFALMAAVACGQFHVKKSMSMPAVGGVARGELRDNSFQINMTGVTGLGIYDDGSRLLNYALSDGANSVNLTIGHDIDGEGYGKTTSGDFEYHVYAVCADESCSLIGALAARVNLKSQSVGQSAFLISAGSQNSYTVLGSIPNTYYDSPHEALGDLRAQFAR